ncbi:MAG TPA: baseplate J/gp47 family protein, partial [Chitinophagaceae bacterium]|nr:baseplate J/gp47 family protein [Chitinophagaceae bacterium]
MPDCNTTISSCGGNSNPLVRGGISQTERFLQGLKAGYVQVDENNYEDWIDFARNYAAFLKYYNTANKHLPGSNWQPFFNSDVSTQLAMIAVQDVEAYRLEIKALFNSLRSDQYESDEVKLKENFGLLFSAILSLAGRLDEISEQLPEEISLKNMLLNLIRIKLAPLLQRLLLYYREAQQFTPAPGIITEIQKPGWKILGASLRPTTEVLNGGLSQAWVPAGIADWAAYITYLADSTNYNYSIYGVIASDININDVAELYSRINHAVNHNLFSGIFDEFLKGYAKVQADSMLHLQKTLGDWPSHAPHYALFLAFLRLFKYPQQQINTLTKRHLDFYYRDVLQLQPKAAQPNHAHLLFELSKPVNAYLLPKGSLFRAGKDSLKKDVFYKLDDNIVINKTQVAELKSFFKAGTAEELNNGMLFASPVANSADGLGGELKTENKEWHPFANKVYVDGAFKKVEMPQAATGFAVSSHYLFLNEGERKVYLDIHTTNNTALEDKSFAVYLSTEKGWYQVEDANVQFAADVEFAHFTFRIPASAPAIVGYNTKTHGDSFNTSYPVLKIILLNEQNNPQYDALQDVKLRAISLKVAVGDESLPYNLDGIKTLLLQNDTSVLDPAKPFLPFGVAPKPGASFIIGNEELFKKKNAAFRFSVEWDGLTEAVKDYTFTQLQYYYPSARIKFLEDGVWREADFTQLVQKLGYGVQEMSTDKGEVEIIQASATTISFPTDYQYVPESATLSPEDAYEEYSVRSRDGFMKLELIADFGYKAYLDSLTDYLIRKAKATGTFTEKPPIEPYTPKIKSIYLSYVAETDNPQLFHIYPFGHAEQVSYAHNPPTVYLFPQFTHEQADEDGNLVRKSSIGEWYIGLKDVEPAQVVTVLFQVLEGTADPLQLKPATHVSWSYLSNNAWKAFKRTELSDQTNQLVQSGIVTFSMPDEATSNNTLLPVGYHWVRAAIEQSAEAVCKLMLVAAQAARVTFDDQGNAPDFLLSPLPAMTISKLKEPVAAIKKIEQPYASFGGRPLEADGHFYTRVSERLRHKQRAINIWDYEHIVLEAFPHIHKVKCLNHTRYEPGLVYNEIAPGHVTIITIPQLHNQNAINPLRPYTNRSDLENIKLYLKKYISCHVQLHVENPRFEEVRMELSVKFFPGFDETYYTELLQQEMTS